MNAENPDFSTTRRLISRTSENSPSSLLRDAVESRKGGLFLQGWCKRTDPEFPLVSVLTIVRNAEQAIQETIRCVLNQDYPNIEYIIVDGCSTDRTVDIIEKNQDAIDFWVSEKDQGFYNALNKAIRLASGDIVNVLNADDLYVDQKTVSRFVKALADTPAEMAYSDTLMLGKESGFGWIRYSVLSKFHFAIGGIPQQSFFYRKSLFDRIGCFDEEYRIAADYEFLLRALYRFKVKARYIAGPLIIFSTGGAASNMVEVERERMLVLKRYFPSWQILLFRNRLLKKIFRETDPIFQIGIPERAVRKLFG